MRIENAIKALTVSFLEQKAVEMVGWYGIGKSSIVRDFTKHLEGLRFSVSTKQPDGTYVEHKHTPGEPVGLIECLVPTYAVEDLRGFPMPDYDNSEMFYSIPPFFPNERKFSEGVPKFGVVFLDEYRLAPDEVVKATTQLLLEGRMGDHYLSQYGHWVVFAASNREQDRVGIGKEAPIITQRKQVYELEPNIQSTVDWMEKHEVSDRILPVFRFFAQSNPGIVLSMKTPDDGKPFCTPRSLVEASQLTWRYMQLMQYKPTNKFDIPMDDFTLEQLASKIGTGAAAGLQQYSRMVGQVPAYADIIKDPGKAILPSAERMDAAYVTITVIEHQAGDYSRDKDGQIDIERLEVEIDSLVTYLMRLPAEFQVVGLIRTFKRCPAIYSHPKVREIARKNPSVLKAISK